MPDASGGSAARKRKKLALGRGLDALIPQVAPAEGSASVRAALPNYLECDIGLIQPNRYQPRSRFDAQELAELSESIRSQGVLQPLLVRRLDTGYELVAGERRLRAAKLAGLAKIPIVVKEVSDGEMVEMSIVENIQRENLNPMEEADAYQRLIDEFGLTQEQAAARVGKSRSAVANFLRLRHLPELIKAGIREGQLSMGHARALLGLESPAQQTAAWQAVVSKSLSVRQTEELVKRLRRPAGQGRARPDESVERHLVDVMETLSQRFGTKVRIQRRGQKGRLEIEFYSDDDLQRLLELLE